jgi:ferredoxin-NADP reductase
VRGPIGGYFVWEPRLGGPLLFVAGGSGVVPLMSMLRHHAAVGSDVPVRLVYSSRSLEDAIYHAELERLAGVAVEVIHTLTREQPPGWQGYARRIDAVLLEEVAWPASGRPLAYVCGSTTLVESAAQGLASLGYEPARIRTERFGPTGG